MKKYLAFFLSIFFLGCCKNNVVISTLSREWISDRWKYTLENRTLDGDFLSKFVCEGSCCSLLQGGGVCSLEYIPDETNWRISLLFKGDIIIDTINATEVLPVYSNDSHYVVLQIWGKESTDFDSFKVIDLEKKNETIVIVSDNHVNTTKKDLALCFAYFKSLNGREEIRLVDMKKGEVTICANSEYLMDFPTEEFERCRIEWESPSSFVFCVRNTDTDLLTFYSYNHQNKKINKLMEASNNPIDFSLEHFSFSFHDGNLYILGDEGVFLKRKSEYTPVHSSENIVDFVLY